MAKIALWRQAQHMHVERVQEAARSSADVCRTVEKGLGTLLVCGDTV